MHALKLGIAQPVFDGAQQLCRQQALAAGDDPDQFAFRLECQTGEKARSAFADTAAGSDYHNNLVRNIWRSHSFFS
jgi:hypothetical protein